MPSYNPSARILRKTPSSLVKDVCLLVRYLAVDVFLLSRACIWQETRCLVMGIQVRIVFHYIMVYFMRT
jgi:hypothetical protein